MVSNTTQKARLLVAYFSYTGNTKRIAQALTERLQDFCDVETVEIVPTRKRYYLHWLAYSFVPDSEVDIENSEMDLSHYDAVLLGFPKWTFSCPPLNRFIRRPRSLNKPKFYLFMTCGGFDAQRFLDSLTHKLVSMGCNIVGSLTIKRSRSKKRHTASLSIHMWNAYRRKLTQIYRLDMLSTLRTSETASLGNAGSNYDARTKRPTHTEIVVQILMPGPSTLITS